MAKLESFEERRKSVKDALLKRCDEAGCGKSDMVFRLTGGCRTLLLKPKALLTEDSIVFNLNYSARMNSPFEDDQDEGVTGMYVTINDGFIRVRKDQRALAMFLYLHPQQSKDGFFMLEDKRKKDDERLSEMDCKFAALDKIRSAQVEELQACYNVMTGNDPSGMETRSLRSDLYVMAERDASGVAKAFEDKRTLIRYKLFNGLKNGVVRVNEQRTALTWRAGGQIIHVLPGENVYDAFADYCLGDMGAETLDNLNKLLSK